MNSYERPHHRLEKNRSFFFRIGFAVSLLVTFLAFEWRTAVPAEILDTAFEEIDGIEEQIIPITRQTEANELPKEERKNPSLSSIAQNVEPVIVPDTSPGDSSTFDSSLVADIVPISNPEEKDTVDEFYLLPEVQPEFPGKEEGLYRFIQKYTRYPEIAKKEGINGTVYMNFVIDENGQVTLIECTRSPHPLFTEEATRVLKLMPKWKPGRQGGKPVKVIMNIPISFKLI